MKQIPIFGLNRLPARGPYFLGREEELAQLDEAWATKSTNVAKSTNVVSLVAWGGVGKSALANEWLGRMAVENYRGAERVFAWSFYRQGAKEEASADEFIVEALEWFGDSNRETGSPWQETGSPWQKGEHLAGLIQAQRTLLVLDGLEPLQNPLGIEGGRLKDPAIAEMIRHLGAYNPGLCLVTTRLEVADIADQCFPTARVIDLGQLPTIVGISLLNAIGVKGEPEELAEAVNAVGGHALALNLLGTYIRDILDRDVRRWREAGLLEAARHGDQRALLVMAAYERWFAGRPELAILRILGLFDRPVRRELVDVLRKPPAIAGLNADLVDLPENEWRWALARLRQARLIEDETGVIDAHPLVREHFGARLKAERPEAWREGHGRLYEHLRDSAKELPGTVAVMAPLFQAMHHGCQAARHQEALDEVYWPRIARGAEFFATRRLGAFGADLAAIEGLFETPWTQPARSLRETDQAFVLNAVAFRLRALGRLREAIEPMRVGLDLWVEHQDWSNAAIVTSNLSELHLSLGNLAEAVRAGEASVDFADRHGHWRMRIVGRTTLANALHQVGEYARAEALFEEAEAVQAENQPEYPQLYSLAGYHYCDLLLSLGRFAEVRAVRARATQTLQWVLKAGTALLDTALDHLSLGRMALALGEHGEARAQVDQAVDGLRQAGHNEFIPRGLLARAALFRETGEFDRARRDLDEAMRIARRGEMRLFQCDAHFGYARLALAEGDKDQAREHLAEARRLVDETGYGRRRPEVAALEAELR